MKDRSGRLRVAILFEPKDSNQRYASTKDTAGKTLSRFADLPALARCAVETQFRDGSKTPRDQAAGELTERHGVFVTLRTDSGELRGCRGTMRPIEGDLVQETWRNAVATAFQDHRFPPVQAEDLPQLRYSVTVLGELEPVASPEGLDPQYTAFWCRQPTDAKAACCRPSRGSTRWSSSWRLPGARPALRPTSGSASSDSRPEASGNRTS